MAKKPVDARAAAVLILQAKAQYFKKQTPAASTSGVCFCQSPYDQVGATCGPYLSINAN